jgi:hypothetical protein
MIYPRLFEVRLVNDKVRFREVTHVNKATHEVQPAKGGPVAFYQIIYPYIEFDKAYHDAVIPFVYEHKRANEFEGILRECRNYNMTRERHTEKPVKRDESGQSQKSLF